MARTWLSIQVDVVHGRGQDLWPRPGSILAAARRHTFAQLAGAIDDAFARWGPSWLSSAASREDAQTSADRGDANVWRSRHTDRARQV